jgi:hypothetical protein
MKSLGAAGQSLAVRYYFRNSPGSLAMFDANRRASSLVSSFSKRVRLPQFEHDSRRGSVSLGM